MAILQALFALITRSAGKILNAIFGWAVRALFGQTSSREQTFLSAIVAAAVAWPLLLVGIGLPKIAALSLAFVPIPHWVPSWTIRIVWLALAVLVPFAVGVAIATKAPPHAPPESFLKLLRGQKDKVTWAHGIIAETVVHSEGYQTRDSKAQALEKELRACHPG